MLRAMRRGDLLNGRLANGLEAINGADPWLELWRICRWQPGRGPLFQMSQRSPTARVLASSPHLGEKDLDDGDWVNGYNTFNSVVISDVNKEIHLLRCTPYSYGGPPGLVKPLGPDLPKGTHQTQIPAN